MSSLEFIEILIEENKKEIELIKNMIVEDDKYPSIKKLNEENLKSVEELLAHLQQTKTILEAWEVVKDKSVDIHDIIYCSSLEVFNCDLYKDYQLTEEEYQTIKKALEVSDE